MPQQGSLELLNDPVASALVKSVNPARLAYTWMDGSPRVVPIWFHWTGDQFVLGTPPKAPKLKTLAADPRVALTIDDTAWPPGVLLVRGRASSCWMTRVASGTPTGLLLGRGVACRA
jgi:nitroimidazol reductase NimA-like FMN-containing flavoprotein (pyridoxamine 5'-phosphate oxidase superfamily)